MNATHKRRLLKLADLLMKDARRKKGVKFDLNNWAAPVDGPKDEDGHEAFATKPKTVPVNCGTYACAVGLACISGEFKRSGLGLDFMESHDEDGKPVFIPRPKYRGLINWRAVEAFFGVTYEQSYALFGTGAYDVSTGAEAERAVARRIRDLVAGKDITLDVP